LPLPPATTSAIINEANAVPTRFIEPRLLRIIVKLVVGSVDLGALAHLALLKSRGQPADIIWLTITFRRTLVIGAQRQESRELTRG
jgi:hypothetical protein